ncbi:MAG: hypothetical protein HZB40_01125 [Rhodocyclales bacterium]|nr:hypothetical protein [Rhodocyclales bacterium]
MQYNVVFGSILTPVDAFGFVGNGTVTTGADAVVFAGKRQWPPLVKLGIFLVITILPLVVFKFGLGFVVALFVIHFLCSSDGSLSIHKSTISNVQRNGKQIKFMAQHPDLGKTRATTFTVDTDQNAVSLEGELNAKESAEQT